MISQLEAYEHPTLIILTADGRFCLAHQALFSLLLFFLECVFVYCICTYIYIICIYIYVYIYIHMTYVYIYIYIYITNVYNI